MKKPTLLPILFGLLFVIGCANDADKSSEPIDEPSPQNNDVVHTTPEPTIVEVEPSEGEQELRAQLDELRSMNNEELQASRAIEFTTELGYSPTQAQNMSMIQDSLLGLSDDELDRLEQHGFVLREPGYPSFTYGFAEIYLEDLPLFISADSILHAVHRSFSTILKNIEREMRRELATMLDSMRQNLADGAADAYSEDVRRDLDLYLAVGKSLLEGTAIPPIQGADVATIDSLTNKANQANGTERLQIFGSLRELDFSQFKPRGHYVGDPDLENYFRAMMWFGRIDFRIMEPLLETNELEFRRQNLILAFALRGLLNEEDLASWIQIDETIGLFVGESDNMTVPQLDKLLVELNLQSPQELDQASDQEIVRVLQKHGFGAQRISSHIMMAGWHGEPTPLSTIFAFFGQRYVVDSHVFSNVVFDRVGNGQVLRMMPDPLDVAYAALGNDQAVELLAPQLAMYPYAPDLEAMRVLTDAHGDEYWETNLYTRWMRALRALSPSTDTTDATSGLPAVARTEAWGRRVLNTQLASWAELRHDTILYAKQSYTGGGNCEFPDVYVDPYPEFFAAIADFAVLGGEVLGQWNSYYGNYFQQLWEVADRLRSMALAQRMGMPHTQEQLDWVNEAVFIGDDCGTPVGRGWYPNLILGEALEFDPTIADVHTQPTDEVGAPVGKVLHVGTGMARLMVVTVDTCNGPRAYVGLASSYYEHTTEDFKRLTDQEWSTQISGSPEWLNDL